MSKRLKTNEKRKNRQNRPHLDSTNNEEKSLSYVETSISQIDLLKSQEESLVESICKKETEHQNLVSKRYNLKQIFQKQREQLKVLSKELEERKILVENTYKEWLEISSDMQSLTSSISEEKKLLECIREEIETHKKVSILVYENGDIESENEEFAFQINSADATNLFNDLVQNDVVEALTIKAIRQLSNLILIVKSIKNNGFKYEITFENEILQEVFEQIDY